MGGLGSALPKTKWLMWIGTVALIGFWPFSKDEVLAAALQKGGATADLVWIGGLVGALFTGIYATRLMRLTFYGERSQYASEHLHSGHGEAPWTMFWTVAVLAAGTVLVGIPRDRVRVLKHVLRVARKRRAVDRAVHGQGSGDDGDRVGGGRRRRALDLARVRRTRRCSPASSARSRRSPSPPSISSTGTRPTTGSPTGPAAALATALYRFFERWVIWGTVDLVAYLVRMLARVTDRRPDRRRAPVRDGARGRARRCSACTSSRRRRCDHRADLPAAGRRAHRRPPAAAAARDRGAGAAGGRSSRPCWARSRWSASTSAAACSTSQNTAWISDFGAARADPLPRRHGRPVALHGAPDRGRRSRPRSAAAMRGRAASARAPTSACCSCSSAALVLLFTAQDLVLFYVGWEVMMIPLLRPDGRVGRRAAGGAATLQFVVYTLVGSLLMLVGDRGARASRAHTFELSALIAPAARVDLALPGLRRRLLHQGAALPAARLAAGRLPRVDARGDRAALGRDLEGRRLRPAALRPAALPERRPRLALALPGPRPGRAPVRRASSPSASPTPAASSPTRASAR